MARHAPQLPAKTFNTDRGSEFTSTGVIKGLAGRKIKISMDDMDDKSSWRDTLFVERLWGTIKYARIPLRVCPNIPEAHAGIGRCLDVHNSRRRHSALDRFPDHACFNPPTPEAVAV